VRAVDTLTKPIAGALIKAWQTGGEGRPWWTVQRKPVDGGKEVRTTDDGWASIALAIEPIPSTYRGPRPGFCLTAQAKDYLVTRSGRIDPMASDRFEVVLTLRSLATVEGRLVDQQGRPVADATVFHTGNAAPRMETKADAQGHFRLDGMPEGKPPVFVSHPRYRFFGQLVDMSAKPRELTLELLAANQTPAPLRTLPPARSHEEELTAARQILRPLWEAAMKSGEEGGRESSCESYAKLDPWGAYDYVNVHLRKQDKNRFVAWKTPLLYAADPEEALAVLESLDTREYMKAFALLGTVREVPDLRRRQKLELLDRATQHARGTTEPDERVHRLSQVALALYGLGKVAETKRIVEIVIPTAKQLSPKSNAAACSAAGEAISLFDLPAGLQMIRATRAAENDYYSMPALFRIVYRIAKQQPDEAERIAAEAIDYAVGSYPAFHRKEYRHEPAVKDLARTITWNEIRLVPFCYGLVAADIARSQRAATAIRNPFVRAYAVGMIAKALAPSDKQTARRIILQAYGTLAEACRNPDPCWDRDPGGASPPVVAAGLLPVVEQIDPTLVSECLWRAVSFRLHRPADDYLVSREPERNDAVLAALLARYDRRLARALSPNADITMTPAEDMWSENYYQAWTLTMIDGNEALERWRATATAPGAKAGQVLDAAWWFIDLLAIDGAHRWDSLAAQYSLWIPGNQYAGNSGFRW
jgi:hypothetical protein